MTKKILPTDNEANQKNRNKGTPGTNRQLDQTQGNRGKQLNPNQQPVLARKPALVETLSQDAFNRILKKAAI